MPDRYDGNRYVLMQTPTTLFNTHDGANAIETIEKEVSHGSCVLKQGGAGDRHHLMKTMQSNVEFLGR